MKPILLAGLSGFLKGLAFTAPATYRSRGFGDVLGAAAKEEVFYRGLGSVLPFGASAAIFAADHVLNNGEKHSFTSGALRFADVMLGGLLYEKAFNQYGILGAIAAHASHNLALAAGYRTRQNRAPQLGRQLLKRRK